MTCRATPLISNPAAAPMPPSASQPISAGRPKPTAIPSRYVTYARQWAYPDVTGRWCRWTRSDRRPCVPWRKGWPPWEKPRGERREPALGTNSGRTLLRLVFPPAQKTLADVEVRLTRDEAPQLHPLHQLVAVLVALPAVVGRQDRADLRVPQGGGGEEPYLGVSMRRLILWTNAYFIDYFQVEGEAERQLDWTCRFDAAVQMQQGLSQGAAVSLEGDGYEHVAAPLLAAASGAVRLQWGLPAGHLDLFLPCERDTLLIQGQVPCNPAAEKSDLIMRRRQARSTGFVALLHPWTEAPVVEEVFPVEGVPTGVLARWVHTRAQRHLWILSNREHREAVALPESAERGMRYTL